MPLALAAVAAVAALVGTVTNYDGNWPLGRMLTGDAFRISEYARDETAVIQRIPAGTGVEVDDRIAPELTRTNVVSLPGLLGHPPDFIAVDLSEAVTGYGLAPPEVVMNRATRVGYVVTLQRGTIVLLQNPSFVGPSMSCTP